MRGGYKWEKKQDKRIRENGVRTGGRGSVGDEEGRKGNGKVDADYDVAKPTTTSGGR